MNKIAFGFLAAMAVLSFTGCKKKSDTAAMMAKMEGFKNDMCKCKDKTCADGVDKAMTDWAATMKTKDGKMPEPSKEEKAKGDAIMKEMSDCRTKAAPPADMAPPAAPAGTEGAAPPAPAGGDTAAPPAGGAAPAGDMKKEEPKK